MKQSATPDDEPLGIETRLAHAGIEPMDYHGFVNPPVVHASTVLFPNTAALKANAQPYTYGRRGTPTTSALEDALSELEGADGTILLSSGLAAVTVSLLAFLSPGDHLLMVDSVYGPTRHFADTMLKRMRIAVEYFDPCRANGIGDLLRPQTRVVFMEAPGSNTFEVLDVRATADAARAAGAISMIDNTWATPLLFRPLEHGVDISIHALTKYPSGGSDVMMGSASAKKEAFCRLRRCQMEIGVNAAPDDSYLVLRGLRSMAVRLRQHGDAALQLARWLETRDEVAQVLHPALPSFAGHASWRRQFSGANGLFSFVLRGSDEDAARFLDALELFGLGYSWGGYESLAIPVDLSDRTMARRFADGPVIRLQVGLEAVADLQRDLDRGFLAISPRPEI